MNDLYQDLKNIYHWLQSQLWRAVNGYPDKGLVIYAVTGTNGKTTTCHVVASILTAEHGVEKVGMLTTINMRIGNTDKINKTKMTTTDSKVTWKNLAKMKAGGVKYVVFEITSHALHQHRLAGLRFAGAIITNIAREHLDYHKTMEKYAAAKELLVGYLLPQAPLVGKSDDEYVGKIVDRAEKKGINVLRFSAQQAGSVVTPLLGDANKQNVLAASLLAKALGISEEKIKSGVTSLSHVPGRMEWIDAPQGWRAIIDYAVTPDALEELYKYVKKNTQGKIYAILGACGERDRGKRPDMARVVASYVDELVITNEDPWSEPEEQIFIDLEKGLVATKTKWQRITDRKAALKHIIQQAKPGDVVVATGKGAEVGMAFATGIVPWSERGVIEELIHLTPTLSLEKERETLVAVPLLTKERSVEGRVRLVINTSQPEVKLSLYKEDALLGEKTWTSDNQLGIVLLQQLEGLLQEQGLTKQQITEIAVNKAGNHWGAVRTGLTIATTLGEALGIPTKEY